ncbi:MAG: hypothetical protein QXR19_15730 [Candidatus Jordarchaeaceae archaeon]
MGKSKTSDFKMLDDVTNTEPELDSFTALLVQGLAAEEKIYGQVFTTLFIKNALNYVAKKFGEKQPEDIKTLSQLREYIITLTEKHHTAYHAFIYAQFKTENELQGQTGAGARIGSIEAYKHTEKKPNVEEQNVDLDNIISTYRQTTIAMKVATREFGYKKNTDGSVDIILPMCYSTDVCQYIFEEGLLKRPDGRLRCTRAFGISQFFKLATNHDWDYDLLETFKPYCMIRIYPV